MTNKQTVELHKKKKDAQNKLKQIENETLNAVAFQQPAFSDLFPISPTLTLTTKLHARDMRDATGLTKPSPNRMTTQLQFKHIQDTVNDIKENQKRKEEMRKQLEEQMQEKQNLKEIERLFPDAKSTITSKPLLKNLNL